MDVDSEPIKVQIAIQGGGAKICALMAAMEVFQDAEKQGVIKVTRIAGTSAGSIVGALFAAGIELGALRETARKADLKKVEKAFPDIDGLYRKGYALLALTLGYPIWPEKELRDMLDRLLTANGIKNFEDLEKKKGIKLRVIASNVTNTEKVVHFGAEDSLVGSLLDSCGLPFFYRCASKGAGHVIVDGGLCENFPADELGEEDEYGTILGVSLDREISGSNPSNFMQFTVSLLNTAINNSVLRAQRHFGDDRLLRLKTTIGTFDFKGAVKKGFDSKYDTAKKDFDFKGAVTKEADSVYDTAKKDFDFKGPVTQEADSEYDTAKKATVKFLGRFIKSYKPDVEVFRGRDWEEQSVEFMMNVYNIYTVQHEIHKFHFDKASYENVVWSMLRKDDPRYDAFDMVTITVQFRPLPKQPLYCYAMSVSEGGTGGDAPRLWNRSDLNERWWNSSELNERWWVCADPDSKPVNATALPAINPDNRKQQWLVLFFTPPLTYQGDDRMYTLRLRDRIKGTLEDLIRTKRDTVGMGFKRAVGSIHLEDIVVYLPQRLSASARITGSRPSGTGQLLTPAELRISGYTEPPGFVPLGWRGRDVDQNAVFSVDIGI